MTCNVERCHRTRYALGLCRHHYLDHYRGRPPRQPRRTAVLPASFKIPRP